MKFRNALMIGMLGIAPLNIVKAQSVIHAVPEAGVFGTVKALPTFIGGVNGTFSKGNNFADVFVGGTLDKNAMPGFAGIVFDNYSWNKNISSWFRDLFLASKGGVTSTLDIAPIKYNTSAGKFNFAVMPAYARNDDFVNSIAAHCVKAISQIMYSLTPKDRVCLEMQYSSIPTENITDTYFGKFSDCFNFTATYSRVLGD